jgi:hypothetical protein
MEFGLIQEIADLIHEIQDEAPEKAKFLAPETVFARMEELQVEVEEEKRSMRLLQDAPAQLNFAEFSSGLSGALVSCGELS